MAIDFTTAGINVASGFSLQAQAPLDVRSAVATIADRDALIGQNATYEGMIVYVVETHATYVRTGTAPSGEDFSGCWRVLSTNDTSVDPSAEAVLTTGDQSIAGTKTFTGKVIIPEPVNTTDAATKNYVDTQIKDTVTDELGVTIQEWSEQLDKVAAVSTVGMLARGEDGTIYTKTITGDNSLTITDGGTSANYSIVLPNVGTAGTYFKVTTDDRGRVTAGENPTTVDGFGITDAVHKTGDTMTGLLKYDGTLNEESFDENTLVTKKYADNVALGFIFHVACRTGTDQNVDGVYADGTGQEGYPGVGATLTINVKTIGDIELAEGNRVLLVGQTDAKQNGAYEVTSVTEDNVVLTRADDLDGHPHIAYNGASFLIAEGANKGKVYRISNEGDITFGTDEINFVQVFAPTPLQAGAGITVTGSTIALAAGNTVGVVSNKVEVLSGTGNEGKVLFAGGDGTAAHWKNIEIDDVVSGVLPIEKGGTGNKNTDPNVMKIGNITLTATGESNVNVPSEGTLATLAGSEVLTNKTVSTDTVGGTALAVQNGDIVGTAYMEGDQSVMPELVGFVIDCGTY